VPVLLRCIQAQNGVYGQEYYKIATYSFDVNDLTRVNPGAAGFQMRKPSQEQAIGRMLNCEWRIPLSALYDVAVDAVLSTA
jgi:hypothetical protein